jgi:hypothetical protein
VSWNRTVLALSLPALLACGAGPPGIQSPPRGQSATNAVDVALGSILWDARGLTIQLVINNGTDVPARILNVPIVRGVSAVYASGTEGLVLAGEGGYNAGLEHECDALVSPVIAPHGALAFGVQVGTPRHATQPGDLVVDVELHVGPPFCTQPTVVRRSLRAPLPN